MRLIKKINWLDPLSTASSLTAKEESWVLLYSGMKTACTGRYSLLALNKKEEVTENFSKLSEKLTSTTDAFSNAWFGYFGYGLKNQLEKLAPDAISYIDNDDMWFAKFSTIVVFDHENLIVELWGDRQSDIYLEILNNLISKTLLSQHDEDKQPSAEFLPNLCPVSSLSSNMTRSEYIEKVIYIKEAIKNGDIYQANLTRKFFGEIEGNVQAFDIFRNLCQISPAPYSAFIKHANLYIISSSPERFLHVDKHGQANIRPIKGSIARCKDKDTDAQAASLLRQSEKDRAENLMIVDLSRNDLAKNCITGSIEVDELFSIETYSTVHHMVSSVKGKKQPGSSTIDLIKGCFPPGSMTGTPKIKAIEICSKLENMRRGIYSGAIGWLGGDGSADLSVVIRTIIMAGNKFEFQVGGAIVNDSTPEKEFVETMTKATGVATALGINLNKLAEL